MILGFKPIHIASSVVLLFGSAMMLIGVVTSYWNYFHMQVGFGQGMGVRSINASGHRGLIWACHDDLATMMQGSQSCQSRFTDYTNMKVGPGQSTNSQLLAQLQYQPWEMASLVMLCMSVGFGFAALFLAPLCCHKCGLIHSLFVYLAALMAVIGMAVYLSYQLGSAISQTTQWMKFDKLGWSFYMTLFGTLFTLLAAVLYSVGACCCKSDDGYKRGTRENV